jgi:hypothetical protein
VTGGRALSFRDVSMGEPAVPLLAGNAEGAKLPRRYVAEKTSPIASELKESPPLLQKYGLCKALISLINNIVIYALSEQQVNNKHARPL